MNVQQTSPRCLDPQLESVQFKRIQRLIEQSVANGSLSRTQDDDILTAITTSPQPSANLCGLFRDLQERVWQGEVILRD
jgi:hypothetical protein